MPEREPTMPPVETTEADVHTEYQQLLTLQEQLERAYEQAVASGDIAEAERLDAELEARMTALEDRVNPLERTLGLGAQYETQRDLLAQAGVVERFGSGELGIKGIDNREYVLPSFETIRGAIAERKAELGAKVEQGFAKLLLVPIGMPLDTLIEKYKGALLKHKRENKLFATKRDPNEADTPLDLDTNEPVWVWHDGYDNADRDGKLVYFPESFDQQNHAGKTKQELLADTRFPGWQVLLIEDLPNIPREGQGQTVGGRPQLETNKTSRDYLATIQQEEPYRNEQGFTPESWLTFAISHLEATNQVIDDYQGNGSASFLTGAYFPTSDRVPGANWYRDDQQASLYGNGPEARYGNTGVRSAVRV